MNIWTTEARRMWNRRCVWTGTRLFWYWLPWEVAKLLAVFVFAYVCWRITRG